MLSSRKQKAPLQFVKRHAFTLTETLMAVVIISSIAAFSLPAVKEMLDRNNLNASADVVTSMLREAQVRARSGVAEDNVPTEWVASPATGLLGNTASITTSTILEVRNFSPSVTVAGVAETVARGNEESQVLSITEVAFQRGTGKPIVMYEGAMHEVRTAIFTLKSLNGVKVLVQVCMYQIYRTSPIFPGHTFNAQNCDGDPITGIGMTGAIGDIGFGVSSASASAALSAVACQDGCCVTCAGIGAECPCQGYSCVEGGIPGQYGCEPGGGSSSMTSLSSGQSVSSNGSADSSLGGGTDQPNIHWTQAQYNAVENGTTVTLTLRREVNGGTGPATADYTIRNVTQPGLAAATAGADYVAITGTVAFASPTGGQTTQNKTVVVTILNDNLTEGDEYFVGEITDVSGNVTIGSPSTTTVLIADDDYPCNIGMFAACGHDNVCPATTLKCDGHMLNKGPHSCAGVTFKRQLSPGASFADAGDPLRLFPDPNDYNNIGGWGDPPTDEYTPNGVVRTFRYDGVVGPGQKVATWSDITFFAPSTLSDHVTADNGDYDESDNFDFTRVNTTAACPMSDYVRIQQVGQGGQVCPLVNWHKFNTVSFFRTGATTANVTVHLSACDIMPQWWEVMVDGPACTINNGAKTITCNNVTLNNGSSMITFGNNWDTSNAACLNGYVASATANAVFQPGSVSVNSNQSDILLTCVTGGGINGAVGNIGAVAGNGIGGVNGGLCPVFVNGVDQCFQPGPGRFIIRPKQVGEAVGNANIAVQRVNGNAGAVSVDYNTIAGTAGAGADYTAVNGTLNFAAGETVKMVAVPIIDDAVQEPIENFRVNLANPTNGAVIASNNGRIKIVDNDGGAGPPTDCDMGVHIGCRPEAVCPGDHFSCDGHSTNIGTTDCIDPVMYFEFPPDVVFDHINGQPGTHRIVNGQFVMTPIVPATVTVEDNASFLGGTRVKVSLPEGTVVEPDDEFAAWISGHVTTGNPTFHSMHVDLDDDVDMMNNFFSASHDPADSCPQPMISELMMEPDYPVCSWNPVISLFGNRAAAANQTADVVFNFSEKVDLAKITYVMNMGDACTINGQSLVCPNQDVDADGMLMITFDAGAKVGAEGFPLSVGATITWPGGVVEELAPESSMQLDCGVTPPAAPGSLRFIGPAFGQIEQWYTAGNWAWIPVERYNGAQGAVGAIASTINGTALSGADFVGGNFPVLFAPGQMWSFVPINIMGDAVAEPDETFTITLNTPTGGAAIGSPATTTFTILDDDGYTSSASTASAPSSMFTTSASVPSSAPSSMFTTSASTTSASASFTSTPPSSVPSSASASAALACTGQACGSCTDTSIVFQVTAMTGTFDHPNPACSIMAPSTTYPAESMECSGLNSLPQVMSNSAMCQWSMPVVYDGSCFNDTMVTPPIDGNPANPVSQWTLLWSTPNNRWELYPASHSGMRYIQSGVWACDGPMAFIRDPAQMAASDQVCHTYPSSVTVMPMEMACATAI